MKTRKTTAFYIEALVLTFFILAFSTVLLQMFAASKKISEQARVGSDAVLVAQNVAAQFSSLLSDGNTTVNSTTIMNGVNAENGYEIYYSADGLQNTNGEYRVVIRTFNESNEIGKLHSIFVDVYNDEISNDAVFVLETKYFASEA